MKILILGASSGFGEAFAKAMAREDHHLVLCAIDADGLHRVCDEIKASCSCSIELLAVDLTQNEGIDQLLSSVHDVDFLINSAGKGTLGDVMEIPVEKEISDIALNVNGFYRITKAYASRMAQRGSGTIINVASSSSYQPLPNFGVYAATKAFALSYTLSVSKEVEKYGVRVMAICPGPTETGFLPQRAYHRIRAKLFQLPLLMSPEKVVASSLKAFKRGRRVYMPGFHNRLLYALDKWSPLEWSLSSVCSLFNYIKRDLYD